MWKCLHSHALKHKPTLLSPHPTHVMFANIFSLLFLASTSKSHSKFILDSQISPYLHKLFCILNHILQQLSSTFLFVRCLYYLLKNFLQVTMKKDSTRIVTKFLILQIYYLLYSIIDNNAAKKLHFHSLKHFLTI